MWFLMLSGFVLFWIHFLQCPRCCRVLFFGYVSSCVVVAVSAISAMAVLFGILLFRYLFLIWLTLIWGARGQSPGAHDSPWVRSTSNTWLKKGKQVSTSQRPSALECAITVLVCRGRESAACPCASVWSRCNFCGFWCCRDLCYFEYIFCNVFDVVRLFC